MVDKNSVEIPTTSLLVGTLCLVVLWRVEKHCAKQHNLYECINATEKRLQN